MLLVHAVFSPASIAQHVCTLTVVDMKGAVSRPCDVRRYSGCRSRASAHENFDLYSGWWFFADRRTWRERRKTRLHYRKCSLLEGSNSSSAKSISITSSTIDHIPRLSLHWRNEYTCSDIPKDGCLPILNPAKAHHRHCASCLLVLQQEPGLSRSNFTDRSAFTYKYVSAPLFPLPIPQTS